MRWLILLILTACAHDVRTNFPGATDDAGTIVIMLTAPTSDVIVTIDGLLVVEGAHTNRIVIEHVPVGFRELVVADGGGDKERRIWVASDHATTVALGMPGAGGPSLLTTVIDAVLTGVVYALFY